MNSDIYEADSLSDVAPFDVYTGQSPEILQRRKVMLLTCLATDS